MSNYSEYLKERAKKEDNFFFGEGNKKMCSNKYYTYKHVLDNDTIIINTNNVRSIKQGTQFVLVVGDKEAVYLKNWNVLKTRNYYEGLSFWTVKLSRAYFKVYTFKTRFDDFCFEGKVDSFDSLLEVAKEQDEENMKIANDFMSWRTIV